MACYCFSSVCKTIFNNKIETIPGVFNLYECQISSSYSIFLLQDPVKSASIKSDELSNQEKIMSESVYFITKSRGKEKKTTRRKRNSHEETNTCEENPVLSDEKEVICIVCFCVLTVPPSSEHNLTKFDCFSITFIDGVCLDMCVYRHV